MPGTNGSSFRGNVVILTGASSGIGRELAYRFAGQQALLALAGRDTQRLEAVTEECRGRGARALAVTTDVAEQDQCGRLIDRTVEEYGRIDTLVNNAGITMWSKLEDMKDLSPFEQIMRVNYLGSVYCTYFALPHLKRTRGRIVAISSLSGKTGVPFRTGYAASKHAVAGFFDSLRIELADSGVTVTLVYPHFVLTETHKRAFGPDGKPLGESPLQAQELMSAAECAGIIEQAAAARKRDEFLTTKGRIAQWLRLISPKTMDRMAVKAVEEGH